MEAGEIKRKGKEESRRRRVEGRSRNLLIYFSGREREIVGWALGLTHGLVLTRDSQIWSWGWNYSGQLGVGENVEQTSTPYLVELPEKEIPIKVVCGGRYSGAITRDGRFYVWGYV
jgi:alpha-tubulin suppressor-like RCC1 family protein